MTQFLLVCAGGAIGSGARYLTATWAAAVFGGAFPYGTLIVNLAGSLLIGIAIDLMAASELRLLVVSGVLGGFTTYSSFNQETLQLIRVGNWPGALANVTATFFGCLLAGVVGLLIARAAR